MIDRLAHRKFELQILLVRLGPGFGLIDVLHPAQVASHDAQGKYLLAPTHRGRTELRRSAPSGC